MPSTKPPPPIATLRQTYGCELEGCANAQQADCSATITTTIRNLNWFFTIFTAFRVCRFRPECESRCCGNEPGCCDPATQRKLRADAARSISTATSTAVRG